MFIAVTKKEKSDGWFAREVWLRMVEEVNEGSGLGVDEMRTLNQSQIMCYGQQTIVEKKTPTRDDVATLTYMLVGFVFFLLCRMWCLFF